MGYSDQGSAKRDSPEHGLCAFAKLVYTFLYQWFSRRDVWFGETS